jgi:hypothetical protein
MYSFAARRSNRPNSSARRRVRADVPKHHGQLGRCAGAAARNVSAPAKREQAEPCGFGGGAELGEQGVHGLADDINISLCPADGMVR